LFINLNKPRAERREKKEIIAEQINSAACTDQLFKLLECNFDVERKLTDCRLERDKDTFKYCKLDNEFKDLMSQAN